MKITIVKNDQPEKEKIKLQDLEPGTVIKQDSYIIGLVIYSPERKRNEIALLKRYEDVWFGLAYGYRDEPIKKVLGKLVEIVVEE